MTPTDMSRKVRQLENDVTSIYELLDKITRTQQRHGERLDSIERTVGGLDTKVTDLDTKVTKLDTKVTKLDTKVTDLDTRLSGRLDKIVALLEQR